MLRSEMVVWPMPVRQRGKIVSHTSSQLGERASEPGKWFFLHNYTVATLNASEAIVDCEIEFFARQEIRDSPRWDACINLKGKQRHNIFSSLTLFRVCSQYSLVVQCTWAFQSLSDKRIENEWWMPLCAPSKTIFQFFFFFFVLLPYFIHLLFVLDLNEAAA